MVPGMSVGLCVRFKSVIQLLGNVFKCFVCGNIRCVVGCNVEHFDDVYLDLCQY